MSIERLILDTTPIESSTGDKLFAELNDSENETIHETLKASRELQDALDHIIVNGYIKSGSAETSSALIWAAIALDNFKKVTGELR